MAFAPSPRPVFEKLGIGPRSRVLLLGEPLPGAEGWPGRRSDPQDTTAASDIVVVACRTVDDVRVLVPAALAARSDDGRLWVAYRLGRRELTRAALGEAVGGLGLDLTWHRQVSLGDGWSAIWFRRRSEFRVLRH